MGEDTRALNVGAGAKTIGELLHEAGYSDREVERLSGVTPLTLRGYARGVVQRPALHVVERLARLLNVSAADVFAACVESIRRGREGRS